MSPNSGNKIKKFRYKSRVYEGERLGTKLGFPTLNLDKNSFPGGRRGVYACFVDIIGKRYKGVLYFGPRIILGEKNDVLEIHVLNFHLSVYGETVSFEMGKFIRGVKNFSDSSAFSRQLESDCQKARDILK